MSTDCFVLCSFSFVSQSECAVGVRTISAVNLKFGRSDLPRLQTTKITGEAKPRLKRKKRRGDGLSGLLKQSSFLDRHVASSSRRRKKLKFFSLRILLRKIRNEKKEKKSQRDESSPHGIRFEALFQIPLAISCFKIFLSSFSIIFVKTAFVVN